MSVIGSNILAGAAGQGGDYTIEESLRFNASQSSYLSWTPASAGNRKTWTWSGWVKLGAIGTQSIPISAYQDGTNFTRVLFAASNVGAIKFQNTVTNVAKGDVQTVALFRDPSAWYHVIISYDSTKTSHASGIAIYVNGVEQTLTVNTAITTNQDTFLNNTTAHYLGAQLAGNSHFDGYITEVNFIDGQALDASSFGEFDATTGVWKPKGYTGTYGTNGFYLPMKLDNTTEGFNTVTWVGNGVANTKISGVGFSPDLVWIKKRNNVSNHNLLDTVRGPDKILFSNSTNAESTFSGALASFDTDGFSLASGDTGFNASGDSYVAWCWDAGNTTVSNTDGSITSSVRANPTYGFSVVSYTGNSTSGATVGHGLGTAPSMVIVKARGTPNGLPRGWLVYHSAIGGTKFLYLNETTAAATGSGVWNDTDPSSSVFTLGSGNTGNLTAEAYIAYCFSEVSGYSKFGSWTGNGTSTGPTIDCGFKPAFIMWKRADSANDWYMIDTTRETSLPEINTALLANNSGQESNYSTNMNVLSNGFQPASSAGHINASGGNYIYMAFKDTREYAFWLDDSGNNNDWQPNGGITTSSTVTDTPTPYLGGGNYAVLNPLLKKAIGATFANANLTFTPLATGLNNGLSTIGVSSGKWYAEATYVSGTSAVHVGAIGENSVDSDFGTTTNGFGYYSNTGQKYTNSTLSTYGSSYAAGDTIGIALDLDAGTLSFYKNGVSQGTAFTGLSGTYFLGVGDASPSGASTLAVNFGQRPFAYTPPTGFKALHTGNLPDSSIVDGSKHFDVVTYTGNDVDGRLIPTETQPDFVWIKRRDFTKPHILTNNVVGAIGFLQSDTGDAEIANASSSSGYVESITSSGFTVHSGTSDSGNVNVTGGSYVAWNWKANGTGVTNTDGSVTSTVSANPTAGFSIVTYTGTGTVVTVGHGLGAKPTMIISKNRDVAVQWPVYTAVTGASNKLVLNANSVSTASGQWNSTEPTSSVFTISVGTDNYIAYCFTDVEGFSKSGSYTGNGSTDGPFVYTGFRPAFVLMKRTDALSSWYINDTGRSIDNDTYGEDLYPDLNNAEGGTVPIDILSNGFKLRTGNNSKNQSGGTYFYMAFAENPFKNSLAR